MKLIWMKTFCQRLVFVVFLCMGMIFPFGNDYLSVPSVSAQTIFFESGWENGEVHGYGNRIAYSRNVVGYFNGYNPPPESGRRYRETLRNGDFSLLIAGYSRNSYAYCYYHVFDMDVEVVAGMKIGYWIYHQEGTAKIAVDGHFADGSTIRDFGGGVLTDQNEVRIHPARRRDPMNQWYYVEVDLSAAAGKTLDFILFGFDNGSDGFTGRYRSYVDDFRIIADSGDICIEAVSIDHWQGQYYNNMDLSGQPVMVRNDGAGFLDFDWGTGSPAGNCGVDTDHFSVHWSRDIEVNAGTYRFTITSDDGFRLYIDGVLMLERWIDQAPTTYSVDVPLAAGSHTVELEYYENGGGAVARLSWEEIIEDIPRSLSSLDLVWDANKEADLAGYWLYYGTASREYTQMIDVGNIIGFRLDQLQEGVTYFLALTAYDFDGNESGFSKEISGVPNQ